MTRVRAVLAAHDMAAERRRAAALDRRHHLQLAEAHMAGIGFTPRGPVVAEDVAHKATVEGNVRVAARVVLTTRDVATEGCSPAVLDGRHHLQLVEAHMAAVGITPSGTVIAKDVRDLQSRSGHDRGDLCRRLGLSFPSA